MSKIQHILAFDPGGSTGVAELLGEAPIKTYQLESKDHHYHLWKLLCQSQPDLVVCERFDNMPLNDVAVNLMAREYIGVIKLYCQSTGKLYVPQQRSAAKGFWTDSKIKTVGLWQPGQKHAMDALRHLLYYLTDSGDNTYIQLLRAAR